MYTCNIHGWGSKYFPCPTCEADYMKSRNPTSTDTAHTEEPTPIPDTMSCAICGYFCNNYHHHNNWFDTTQPVTREVTAITFAEWIGEQGLFNGLSPDNIRRWHKMVGNSKARTTEELYKDFINAKS